jgi:hypothetical protein
MLKILKHKDDGISSERLSDSGRPAKIVKKAAGFDEKFIINPLKADTPSLYLIIIRH